MSFLSMEEILAAAEESRSSVKRKASTNCAFNRFIAQYSARYGSDFESSLKARKLWNRMSKSQKSKYLKKPQNVDKDQIISGPGCCMKKRSSSSSSSCPKKRKPNCPVRRKPRCAPKPKCPARCPPKRRCAPKPKCCPKPRCARKRKPTCCKPTANNGYLKFLREFRRKHCGLKPKELVMRAARAWCRLSKCQKDAYRRQPCKKRGVCNPCG